MKEQEPPGPSRPAGRGVARRRSTADQATVDSHAARHARVLAIQAKSRDALAIRRFLMMAGSYDVLTACNVERGTQILEKQKVDALVVDESLPDGSGIELVRRAEEAGFEGAVIVTAQEMDRRRAREADQLGAANYVVKSPSWPAPLPEMLLRALERAHLMQQNRLLRAQLRELELMLRDCHEQREHLESRDPATGYFREWFFEEFRAREVSRANRRGETPSVVEFDVRDFGGLRERYGDGQAQHWLRTIADRVLGIVRASDLPSHRGAGRFVVLPFDCDAQGAKAIAGRVQEAVEELRQAGELPPEVDVRATVSPSPS